MAVARLGRRDHPLSQRDRPLRIGPAPGDRHRGAGGRRGASGRRRRGPLRRNGGHVGPDGQRPNGGRLRHLVPAPVLRVRTRGHAGVRRRPAGRGGHHGHPLGRRPAPALRGPHRGIAARLPRPAAIPASAPGRIAPAGGATRTGTRAGPGATRAGTGAGSRRGAPRARRAAPGTVRPPSTAPGTDRPPRAPAGTRRTARTAPGTGRTTRAARGAGADGITRPGGRSRAPSNALTVSQRGTPALAGRHTARTEGATSRAGRRPWSEPRLGARMRGPPAGSRPARPHGGRPPRHSPHPRARGRRPPPVARQAVKVREAIRRIERDGWRLVRTRGSHRQYKHPVKAGLVTIAGRGSDDLTPGTAASILRQAGLR